MSSDGKESDSNAIEPLNVTETPPRPSCEPSGVTETPPPQPVCLVMQPLSDEIDARSLFDVFSRSRSPQPPMGQLSTAVDSIMYNMKHPKRGKCLIINNRNFDSHTGLSERRGTEVDAKALHGCFRSLDFDVFTYTDASAKDITHILESASKEDHRDNDCIVISILTHGEQGGLWARDGKYTLEAAFSFFKGDQCPSLAGKPKIFFIQACQGDRLDKGVGITSQPPDQTDSGSYRIPNFADFVIAYSTVPGYYSWRNTTLGSWYIQALVETLGRNAGKNMDLLTMLTIVNRRVAYDFESNVPNDQEFDKKKQIPCITSMLTRLVYFPSKI